MGLRKWWLLDFAASIILYANVHSVTLYPSTVETYEYQNISFTCSSNGEERFWSTWTLYLTEPETGTIQFINDKCNRTGFLTSDKYSATCNGTNSFTLHIQNVTQERHKEIWGCAFGVKNGNNASITVNVRVSNIEIQLQNNVSLTENTTAKFTCNTSYSRPKPTIEWFLVNETWNTRRIQQGQENILITQTEHTDTFGLVSVLSTLQYTVSRRINGSSMFCSVADHEETRSHMIVLDILYPPDGPPEIWYFQNGSTYRVIEADLAKLSCSVNGGNPTPKLTWDCYNPDISTESTTNELITSNISLTAARYQTSCSCESRHKLVSESTTVILDILYPPSPPTFTVSLDNVGSMDTIYILEGRSLVVLCRTESNPNSSYTWTGAENYHLDGDTFNISRIHRSANGTYSCEAKNIMNGTDTKKIGRNASVFTVHVLYPADVDRMENMNILEGSLLNVSCPVKRGNPKDTVVVWSWGAIEINRTDLIIENITKEHDNTTYKCTVYNWMRQSGGNYSKEERYNEFHLSVFFKAEVTNFTINNKFTGTYVTVYESDTVSIKCFVEGNPIPDMQLFLFGKVIKPTSVEKDTLTHELKSVHCIDAGEYTCTGSNKYTKKDELSKRNMDLIVRCSPKPYYTVPSTIKLFAFREDSVTLNFTARDYLEEPKKTIFNWYKGMRPLDTTKNKLIISTEELQTNLTIHNLTNDDFGTYLLTVNNSVGHYLQSFKLTVKASVGTEPTKSSNSSTMVIVIMIGILIGVVAVLVVGVYFYRKRRSDTEKSKLIYQNVPSNGKKSRTNMNTRNVHIEETSFDDLQEIDDVPQVTNEPTEYCNSPDSIAKIDRIKVSELFSYVLGKADDSFGADYHKLPTQLQMACIFARKPENIALNRYNGIYPYDHSRVTLNDDPDFFINACYIDGYRKSKAYIASLGPTEKTTSGFKTFWKMVWYERSDIIVMLTNLREPSGMKCEQYWPGKGANECYGDISVSAQTTDVFAEYTVRTFILSKNEEHRSLTQLHYTAWPDKKVPEDTTSLVVFRKKMKATPTSSDGPIIVHCSAGIGRTGTLIALDRLIEEGQSEGSVNVYECVKSMREQRVKMVQTLEQYIYIYKALVNALTFDCEEIPVETFPEYVDSTSNNIYSRQFQQLRQSVETDREEELAARSANSKLTTKNRRGADVPGTLSSVLLYRNRQSDVPEYINAVYLNSFKKRDNFIVAQSPLPCTTSDFICMIYQENCSSIVAMEDLEEPGMVVGKYLPDDGRSLTSGHFTVSCSRLETKQQYIVRKMNIKLNGKFDSREKVVYHFQYTKWMRGNETPGNAREFMEFVHDVEEYANQLGDDRSHVLVYCLKANQRSGLFCALSILMENIEVERQVSVLNTLRHLRTRRQTAITSMEQLRFCYEAVSAYIKMYLH